MTVHVLGPKDRAKVNDLATKGTHIINTTSGSRESWTRGLSPFYLGPVPLYGGRSARKMENGWQYSKVYAKHVDAAGDPTEEYLSWATEGWNRPRADRYPMGKGAIPEYSYWDGQKLGYVEARKQIYFPLYSNAVRPTAAFRKLQTIYQERGEVYLWDFDGYDYMAMGKSLKEVMNDPDMKMGHAFILAMLLNYL